MMNPVKGSFNSQRNGDPQVKNCYFKNPGATGLGGAHL